MDDWLEGAHSFSNLWFELTFFMLIIIYDNTLRSSLFALSETQPRKRQGRQEWVLFFGIFWVLFFGIFHYVWCIFSSNEQLASSIGLYNVNLPLTDVSLRHFVW